MQTRFVSGSLMLDFHINIEQEANDRHKINAECLGTVEPFASISRCVKSRPQANDLKQLLVSPLKQDDCNMLLMEWY
jgi:hypothetical protein